MKKLLTSILLIAAMNYGCNNIEEKHDDYIIKEKTVVSNMISTEKYDLEIKKYKILTSRQVRMLNIVNADKNYDYLLLTMKIKNTFYKSIGIDINKICIKNEKEYIFDNGKIININGGAVKKTVEVFETTIFQCIYQIKKNIDGSIYYLLSDGSNIKIK